MEEINPYHRKISLIGVYGGFCNETKKVEVNGEMINVLVKDFITSDYKEFYTYIDQITPIFFSEDYRIDRISNFLIITHQDSTADIFINNIPIILHIMGKRVISPGDIIKSNDIVDILSLKFEGIEISKEDNIIFCFKKGWKFGLYFDFRQRNKENILDVDELYIELGSHYKHLAYEEEYSFLENSSIFNQMFVDGWFPFIQLLGGEFKKLSSLYEHKEVFDSLITEFLNTYDRKRIYSFIEYWWKNEIFNEKKIIICAGIEAFLTNTESGFINCIKNLYSEIEGILRINFFNEKKKNPKFSELKEYIYQKGKTKFVSKDTLGFPDVFYQYLDEVIFKDFDLTTGEVDLSRHTSSHGVAKLELYTKARALQAILTLDQMYFYLT